MSVTYQTVNIDNGGGSANLLINPRGKINQANESAGVLAAGQYFCDGWKAGSLGAEVYIDSDGFRLISGSIVQLVPNNIGLGRTLRANMDKINGDPVIIINGESDSVASNDADYIKVEISGNNTKFSRIILADSSDLPIYQQSADELSPCQRFYLKSDIFTGASSEELSGTIYFPVEMFGFIAFSYQIIGGGYIGQSLSNLNVMSTKNGATWSKFNSVLNYLHATIIADSRP